jgi:hypothetical protein
MFCCVRLDDGPGRRDPKRLLEDSQFLGQHIGQVLNVGQHIGGGDQAKIELVAIETIRCD